MKDVVKYFAELDPVLAAFYATCFTWLLTATGAATVFFFKTILPTFFNKYNPYLLLPYIGINLNDFQIRIIVCVLSNYLNCLGFPI